MMQGRIKCGGGRCERRTHATVARLVSHYYKHAFYLLDSPPYRRLMGLGYKLRGRPGAGRGGVISRSCVHQLALIHISHPSCCCLFIAKQHNFKMQQQPEDRGAKQPPGAG